jgi:uncharacterized protein YqhQ
MNDLLTTTISVLYYAFVAVIAGLILYNLVREKDWKKEIIYVIILIPFLLRLFMLK